MILTIHQPEYLVWLGLIDKIAFADKYVVLDNVQYRKQYFQNRNRIVTGNRLIWVTVPVKTHPLNTLIKDIEISNRNNWAEKNFNQIENAYRKVPHFYEYYPEIERILTRRAKFLVDLNLCLLKWMLKKFDIGTDIMLASDIDVEAGITPTDRLINICKAAGATTYLSGPFGKKYLELDKFHNAGVEVIFHQFEHPCYPQAQSPFTPHASAIDLLFNHGPKAREILFPSDKI